MNDIKDSLQDKAWALIRTLSKIEGVVYRPDLRFAILGKSFAPSKRGKGHLHLIDIINDATNEAIVHVYSDLNNLILGTDHYGMVVEEIQLPVMINRAVIRHRAKIKAVQAVFTKEEFNRQKKCYDEIVLENLGDLSEAPISSSFINNMMSRIGSQITKMIKIAETNIVILHSPPNWDKAEKMIGKNRVEALKPLRCFFYGIIRINSLAGVNTSRVDITWKMKNWEEDAWLPSSFKQCLRHLLKNPPK